MKTTLLSLALVAISSAKGQQQIDFNNVNANVSSNGFLFTQNTDPGYEVPKNSDVHALYVAGLCITASDVGGQLKSAVGAYAGNGADFSPGPYSTSLSYYDPLYLSTYGQSLWSVSRAEIQNHMANYNQSGYTTPVSIAQWPGNSVGGLGLYPILAPFIDLNNNGLYEPNMGDYPDVRGDKTTFFIMNDVADTNSANPLGIEVHGMVYQYATSGYLDNTTFIHYTVINNFFASHYNFNLGLFTDFDLGNGTDDRVGCDSTKSLIFAYNESNIDAANANSVGYGLNPPSVGVIMLNHEMDNFVTFSSVSTVPYTVPTSATQYFNVMNGRWSDGSPRLFGGNGTTTTGLGAPATSFMFPGNPSDPMAWSELSVQTQSGDKSGLMSVSLPSFLPSQVECFDFAVLFVREEGNNNLQNVQSLLNLASVAQSDYDAMTDYNCTIQTAGLNELNETEIGVFPNPSAGKFTLSFGDELLSGKVVVSDVNGRLILSQDFDNVSKVNLEMIGTEGIYIATIQTNKGMLNKRIIIK